MLIIQLIRILFQFIQNLPENFHTITMATIAIFCDRCFRDKEFDQGLFYISSCYHILCAGCRGNSDICAYCNKTCQFLEISNELPPHVKAYFMLELMDQRTGSVSKIWKFQTQQYCIWMDQYGHHTVENCNIKIKEAEENNLRRRKMNERLQQEMDLKRKLDEAMR